MKSIVRNAAAVATSLLLLMPAAALARHGQDDPAPATSNPPTAQDDHGGATPAAGDDAQNGSDDAKPTNGASDDRGRPTGTPAPPPSHGRKATRAFDVRGKVVSVDVAAGTVVMTIIKANHGGRGGRALAGHTITLDTTGARLDLSDVNGDGTKDLGDVGAGDRVQARVLLPRPLATLPSSPVLAARFRDDNAH